MTRRVIPKEIPLRAVRVRTVRPDEEPRWNDLMRQHHYLGFRNFCGKRLRQVAVLGWHAAALHYAARDRRIGWTSLQRRQRLFLVANQSRFLLLCEARPCPQLASRVLGLSLRQLPREWLRLHAAPVLLAETLVDASQFAGTCYRAANWIEVGSTQGFGRVRGGARSAITPTACPSACTSTRCGVTRGSSSRRSSRSPTGNPIGPASCSNLPNGAPCSPISTGFPKPADGAACAIRCAPC